MKRDVDIGSYLPPITGEKREFKVIAETESQEFTAVWTGVDAVHQNQYLFDSDDYGVKRREKMLKIQPYAGDTLEAREFRIYTLLNNRLPYTWRILLERLGQFCGEGMFSAKLKPERYVLDVELDSRIQSKIPVVMEMLQKMLPTDILLERACRTEGEPGVVHMTGAVFPGMSVTQLPQLTWEHHYKKDISIIPLVGSAAETLLPPIQEENYI